MLYARDVDDTCLVCRELSGAVEVPGGLLYEDGSAVAFHVPPLPGRADAFLGHVLVVTRRHVDHLGDLTVAEVEAVARTSRLVAGALRAEGAERVHVAVVGLGVAHFHEHLLPRYPGVPAAAPWTALDELPDAPHGGPAEIAALVERLRARLPPGAHGSS